jgi:hypothetical protein
MWIRTQAGGYLLNTDRYKFIYLIPLTGVAIADDNSENTEQVLGRYPDDRAKEVLRTIQAQLRLGVATYKMPEK